MRVMTSVLNVPDGKEITTSGGNFNTFEINKIYTPLYHDMIPNQVYAGQNV